MDPARGAKLSTWLNDARVRGRIYQTLLLACVGALAWGAITNALANMRARGMPMGFGFWNQAAGFDIADFAGWQAPAVVADDGDVEIGKRPPDSAAAALFPRYRGDPARFAGAAALRDRDAELLLEPLPFFEQQRCRA